MEIQFHLARALTADEAWAIVDLAERAGVMMTVNETEMVVCAGDVGSAVRFALLLGGVGWLIVTGVGEVG